MTTRSLSGVGAPATEAEYRAGWSDKTQALVERFAAPSWLVYLAAALVVGAVVTAIKWADGSYPVGTLFALHLLPAFTLFYGLGLMHYLDRWAVAALAAFAPALNATQFEREVLEYRLSTLPAGKALVAGIVGAAFGAVVYGSIDPTGELANQLLVFTSPAARVVEIVVPVLMWAVLGTLIYHTVHQLRVVSDIYTRCTTVNVFHLDPLYALSRLAARTAFGILILAYAWFFVQPRSQELILSWPYTVGFSALAVFTFLWPLLGIHAILVREKQKVQFEASSRLEAAIRSLHAEADANNLAAMDGLNKLMSSLALEQAAIDRISTWPWQRETPRLVATAVLTPLIVYMGQLVLAAVLGL